MLASPGSRPGGPCGRGEGTGADPRDPAMLWSFDHNKAGDGEPLGAVIGARVRPRRSSAGSARGRGDAIEVRLAPAPRLEPRVRRPRRAEVLLHLDPAPALRLVVPEVQVRTVPEPELVHAAADVHEGERRYGYLTITGGWPKGPAVAEPLSRPPSSSLPELR